MGLSDGAILTLMILACICGLIVAFLFSLLIEACGRLWSTLTRGHAMAFVDFAVYLYARASKAVSSSFSSTSELPHSEIHRRRDLIGRSATLHKYPGVIPSYDSRSERMLNRYGRYLNVNAKIPDTNATVFRVRSWLRNCERNHNGRDGNPLCQPLYEDGRGYPLWLIDIEQRCVVPFQASLSYFALSYVWGQVETAKMERSNLVQLQQPGSLLGPHRAVELPKTIKDAMFLTGFLGHRYLWCDRLCIVQDDESSKLPQIQQMADTYARAYCTFIAFDNLDANSGLHGLPSLTRYSHRQSSTSSYTERARWCSRAWTFQEELFSVRIIRLSGQAVDWQCSPLCEEKSTRGSNVRNTTKSMRSLQFKPDIRISGLGSPVQVGGMFRPSHASLEYYMELVELYSQRLFNEQHPEDRFNAFSSVQSILKASYPGAFIQGIPESLLAQCLLWETGASSHNDFVDPITGRSASTWSCHNDFVDPVTGRKASSWSWIGWSCSIYYTIFTDQIRRSRTCEGLVSWYVSLEKDSRRYPVSMAEERWARHRKSPSISISFLNAKSTGRMDMSLESQVFEHIVPLSAGSPEPSALEAKNLCSFLHGRVQTARFQVHLKYTDMKRPFCILLCETSGDYAGVLCGRSGLLKDGQLINLIAISEGSTEAEQWCKRHRTSGLVPEIFAQPPSNKNCRVPPIPDRRLYEFYDALWVEYEDGVAYRKDIGRVCKEVWERETLGWVDATLG